MNLKGCIYIGGFESSQLGAVGTHNTGIINGLVSHFGKDNVYCIFPDGCTANDIKVPDQMVFKLPWTAYFGRTGRSLKYAKGVRAILGSEPTKFHDFFIYNRFCPFITPPLLQNCMLPSVVEYNDLFFEQIKFAAQNKNWSALGRFIRTSKLFELFIQHRERFTVRASTLMICMTDTLKAHLISLDNFAASKFATIPNATDIKTINETLRIDTKRIKKKLGYNDETLLLVHAGTLTYWDGLLELLRAISETKSREHIHLLIIGNGSLKEKIRECIKVLNLARNVTMLDSMERDEALQYIRAADCVPILKTINSYDLCPMKFYEALGCGKNILCTDIPLINQIEELKAGWTVPLPLTVENISEKLDLIYKTKETLRGNERKITEIAKSLHTWDSRVSDIVGSLTRNIALL